MASLGTLALDLIAKTGPFDRALMTSKKGVVSFAKSSRAAAAGGIASLTGSLRGLGSMAGSVTGQLGILGGAAGIGGLAAFAIKSAADLETTKTQFETMLGSAEKADKVVSKLFDFSKVTPFEPDEIFGAGKGLLGAGFREDEIIEPLRRLGDIAAGSGARLEDLVRIFGKVKSTGKVELETLNQLAERNAVSYNDLARSMGVSTAQMTKMISAGKVGLPDLTKAIQDLTDKGGKFAGGMEAQSKTLSGLFSTLKGNLSAAAAEIGAAAIDAVDLKDALTGINESMSKTDWKEYGKGIADVAKSFRYLYTDVDLALLQLNILSLKTEKQTVARDKKLARLIAEEEALRRKYRLEEKREKERARENSLREQSLQYEATLDNPNAFQIDVAGAPFHSAAGSASRRFGSRAAAFTPPSLSGAGSLGQIPSMLQRAAEGLQGAVQSIRDAVPEEVKTRIRNQIDANNRGRNVGEGLFDAAVERNTAETAAAVRSLASAVDRLASRQSTIQVARQA